MRSAILLAVACTNAFAQPTTFNTRLRSHVPISSPSWAAGNWGHETPTGRYLRQTLGSGGLAEVDCTDPDNASVIGSVPGTAGGGISVKR